MGEWRRNYEHFEFYAERNLRYIPWPRVRLYVSVGDARYRHELTLYAGLSNEVAACHVKTSAATAAASIRWPTTATSRRCPRKTPSCATTTAGASG